jgi:hypothetical protein
MQWSHELSEARKEGYAYISSYGHIIEPGTTYEITINIVGGTEVVGRYLGCVMIGFMPEEGLEEVLLSLRDMLEFYSHKPEPRPARLSPKAIGATIGDKKKRPDLVIT